ncbi:metallophosphoesterase [Corynebacterium breve]|uniref:Metallophosphoesterase n=1 Tax=Corynebacterium breve TaxID=3049799 RepID=A0ABY8VL18_9CORY|nr:metallophosphoesterase [Corynebacterium breve]WIM68240.1 metallophosphoesterase [Corynebacterium breve]
MTASFNRRRLLQGGTIAAAAAAIGNFATPARAVDTANTAAPLQFNTDGTFKIMQFNDTQDDHLTDRRTLEFMGKALDHEKPNFALINGDVITSGPQDNEQVYQALNNVVMPMESRGIPWAVTFGNHDEDSTEEGGTTVFEPEMTNFVRQYRYNYNAPLDEAVYGASNTHLLVNGSTSSSPEFAIWMLDSGRYLDDALAGQPTDELPSYDYIRSSQIKWYRDLSIATEEQYGKKIPGLMYFHIPTFEHRDMWFGGPYNDTEAQHKAAVARHGIEGVKHEGVYVGAFNSGIYSAARERGDILGMYCGHDHINTFHGNYFGVELGYSPGTGFGTYGLNDGTWDMHTLRGARVFELNENTDRVYESTRLVFAKDLGIDMNPEPQKIEQPEAFPEYVTPGNSTPVPTPAPAQGSIDLSSNGLSSI